MYLLVTSCSRCPVPKRRQPESEPPARSVPMVSDVGRMKRDGRLPVRGPTPGLMLQKRFWLLATQSAGRLTEPQGLGWHGPQ